MQIVHIDETFYDVTKYSNQTFMQICYVCNVYDPVFSNLCSTDSEINLLMEKNASL